MRVYPCVRNFFPLATMVGGFQASTVAFAKPYFYSLGFLCATGCSTPYWSYSPPCLNFALGVQSSASFSLHFKSPIFKPLRYKEGYCFNHWIEKKKTGLTLNILATKLISSMKRSKNRLLLQITSTCMKCIHTKIIFLLRVLPRHIHVRDLYL